MTGYDGLSDRTFRALDWLVHQPVAELVEAPDAEITGINRTAVISTSSVTGQTHQPVTYPYAAVTESYVAVTSPYVAVTSPYAAVTSPYVAVTSSYAVVAEPVEAMDLNGR